MIFLTVIEQVDSEEEALISLESFDRASPEIWQEKRKCLFVRESVIKMYCFLQGLNWNYFSLPSL